MMSETTIFNKYFPLNQEEGFSVRENPDTKEVIVALHSGKTSHASDTKTFLSAAEATQFLTEQGCDLSKAVGLED